MRVVNKNIKPFAGMSLLEIKIKQLLNTPGLDGVCVNSNDAEMLRLAEVLGAETCLREQYFASNDIPMSDVYANIAENVKCDFVLLTHVTNPLADEETYIKTIDAFRKLSDDYDSIVTVSDVKEFLYLDGKPLNYDPRCKPRSQDLPEIVKLNHVASLINRDTMIAQKDIIGIRPYFLKIGDVESVDIDTELDFSVAEFLYKARNPERRAPVGSD